MSTGTSVPDRQEAIDGAQQKAQEVAGQAQEKAQAAAQQAKGKLREQLDERSSQAAAQINEQASDLRTVGQSLREQGKDGPAQAADRLAGYADRVGGYLRDKDSTALLNDAEDFARRQPWAIGAGALALGFAAARFLKASSRQRYSTRIETPAGPGGTLGGPRDSLYPPVPSPLAGPVGSPPPTSPPPGAGLPRPGVIPPTGV